MSDNIVWEFVEPLEKDGTLNEFERCFAYQIPVQLKALIQKFNCGYPDQDIFDVPHEGLVFSHLLSFNQDSEESVYLFLDVFKDGKTLWGLPFATDGFGNVLFEKESRIFFWSHETGRAEPVADSITELLSMLHK